jgi:hypothetical protein
VSAPPRILYCHCAYARVVPTEVKGEVLARLVASDVEFEAVADLCEMSARRDPRLAELANGGTLRIAACFPRAVRGLFMATGHPLPDDAEVHNMRTQTAGDVADSLLCAPDLPGKGSP